MAIGTFAYMHSMYKLEGIMIQEFPDLIDTEIEMWVLGMRWMKHGTKNTNKILKIVFRAREKIDTNYMARIYANRIRFLFPLVLIVWCIYLAIIVVHAT